MIDEITIKAGNRIAEVRKILLMNTCLKLLPINRINNDNTNESMENNKRWSALILIKSLSKERGINKINPNNMKYVFLSEDTYKL